MRPLIAVLLVGNIGWACSADGLIWMPPHRDADPMFRFVSKGRAGFIDRDGKVRIPASLDVESNWGQAFHDGLLSLGVSDGPFLDKQGKVLLKQDFYRIWDFSEGLAAAMEKDDSFWGYIDRSGKFVIPPRFPAYPRGLVSSFSEGLAAVEVAGKLGYIDRTGEYAIAPHFVAGTDFRNGLARVATNGPCIFSMPDHFDPCMRMSIRIAPRTAKRNPGVKLASCKWRYIDKTGRQVVPDEFENAFDFEEGLAAVRVDMGWGFIDRQGNFVIPPRFETVHSFSDGLALVSGADGSGFIDKTGAWQIRVPLHEAEPFSEGMAVIGTLEAGYHYIDRNGRQAIPRRFQRASRFFHGLAHVQISESRFAYVRRDGSIVFEYNPEK